MTSGLFLWPLPTSSILDSRNHRYRLRIGSLAPTTPAKAGVQRWLKLLNLLDSRLRGNDDWTVWAKVVRVAGFVTKAHEFPKLGEPELKPDRGELNDRCGCGPWFAAGGEHEL
jgi:hypothetical protein